MKFGRIVDWKVFTCCFVASFLLAFAVSWMSGLGYIASWGIVMVVWVLLGLSTLADDE